MQNIRFTSAHFNTIVICLMERPVDLYIVNNGIVIPVVFNRNEFDRISTTEDYFEYFCMKAEKAFEKTKRKYDIPDADIMSTWMELKEKAYKNSWNFKNKSNKNLCLQASLNCELDINEFRLSLNVNRNNEEIFNETILKTDPDEVAFDGRFKDIEIGNNTIVITDKKGGKLYELKL